MAAEFTGLVVEVKKRRLEHLDVDALVRGDRHARADDRKLHGKNVKRPFSGERVDNLRYECIFARVVPLMELGDDRLQLARVNARRLCRAQIAGKTE